MSFLKSQHNIEKASLLKLLCTTSICAAVVAIPGAAEAACSGTGNLAAGTAVECTGSNIGPVIFVGDNLDIEIDSGATFENTAPVNQALIDITGDDNIFTNDGTVIATSVGGSGLRNSAIVMDAPNGDVTFNNNGSITSPNTRRSVSLAADLGNITFANTGSISSATLISGFDVSASNAGDMNSVLIGLSVSSYGQATIDNIGGQISAGFHGAAIELNDTATVGLIRNSGTIISSNAFSAAASLEISSTVVTNATLEVSNLASGTLISSGDQGFGASIDIQVPMSTVDTIVNNEGRIEVSGDEATGIAVQHTGIGNATVVNSGTIQTTGFFSNAVATNVSSGTISLTNTATGIIISTRNGLQGDSTGGAILINEGSIDVTGRGAGLASNVTGDIVHQNDGNITTTGDGSRGMSSNVTDGDASITNNGQISTSGNGGTTRGISNVVSGAGNSQITNSATGSISVLGANVIGITGSAAVDIATIQNAGSLSVEGSDSIGISVEGDGFSISNTGQIVASNGAYAAIESYQSGGTRQNAIANAGSIATDGTGILLVGTTGGIVTIDSAGTIEGSEAAISSFLVSDVVTIGGNTTGDILLREWDDSLAFTMDAADNYSGLLDGGDGVDVLSFAGLSTIAFEQDIANFEAINVVDTLRAGNMNIAGLQSFTVDNGGTLSLAVDTILNLSAGNFVAADGSTIIFDIDASNPVITTTGTATFDQGSQIAINVLDVDTLVADNSFDALTADGGITDASASVVDNSLLFDFEKTVVGGNILRITARQILMIDEAVDANDIGLFNAAGALQAIVDNGDPASRPLATIFGQLPDDAAVSQGVQGYMPDDSGAIFDLQAGAVRSVSDAIFTDSLHGNESKSGWRIWGFGMTSDLDGDVKGYHSAFDGSQDGFAIGIDKRFNGADHAFRFGFTFYDVDSDYSVRMPAVKSGDIAVAGGILYGEAILNDKWRLHSQLAFGDADVDGQRFNLLLDEAASFTADGKQTMLQLGLSHLFDSKGWNFELGGIIDRVWMELDGYSEATAGPGGLNVGEQGADSFQGQIFFAGAKAFDLSKGWKIQPDMRIGAAFNDQDFDPVTARFQMGGPAFLVPVAERNQTAFKLNAGLSLFASDSFTIRAAYDGSFGAEADHHAGMLTATLGW
ncbi:autotransporter domain-containing protein [Parasphingorhabdus sp.]|uniref:autotransporter domain-containing protein n=1 Tax=Parasphingorhabdus sp. TaxID=2709688 RepID=UPI003263B3E1